MHSTIVATQYGINIQEILLSITSNDSFWTIIGVIVGYVLAEITRSVREKREDKRIFNALEDELKANLYQIPQKRDIIRQMIEALSSGKMLSGSSVTAVTVVYDNHLPHLSKLLKPIQRDNLHTIFGRLKQHDQFLANFEINFKADLATGVVANSWKAYESQLRDIDYSYGVIEQLISLYLNGKPEDVLHRHSDDQTIPRRFTTELKPENKVTRKM